MRTVSTIQKLHVVLGIMFILAGSARVTPQTHSAAGSPSTSKPDEKENSRSDHESETVAVPNASTASVRTFSEISGKAVQSTAADGWQFQFSPYFWMAGLHGTTGTPNRNVHVNEGFSDVWHSLKFAFMAAFEARKDKLILLADAEYVSLEDDRAAPGLLFSAANAKIKMFIFDPAVGYRVFDDQENGAFVDVLGGTRIWRISTDLTFSPGILPGTEVEASRTWVDAVGGLRGKATLSEKVFVTGKLDLGGGGSKFTYHFFGGGGYNITPKIAVIFGYRVLDVNYDRNNFVYDMNQRGPIVGAGFKF